MKKNKIVAHNKSDGVYFNRSSGLAVFCDGFLKFEGMENGCSVALVSGDKVRHLKRYLLEDSKLKRIYESHPITNNTVEYFAMYRALQWANKLKIPYIYSDSELIVKQVNEEWGVTYPHLKKWNKLCRKLLNKSITVLWISRLANVEILGH